MCCISNIIGKFDKEILRNGSHGQHNVFARTGVRGGTTHIGINFHNHKTKGTFLHCQNKTDQKKDWVATGIKPRFSQLKG